MDLISTSRNGMRAEYPGRERNLGRDIAVRRNRSGSPNEGSQAEDCKMCIKVFTPKKWA